MALALGSCYSPGDGIAPPLDQIYYPTGLALSEHSLGRTDVDPTTQVATTMPPSPSKYLFVASSDFDLQYRSSSLMSLDLDVLRTKVPRNCTTDTDCDTANGEVCDDSIEVTVGGAKVSHVPSYFCVQDPSNPCGAVGVHTGADQVLYPGRCGSIDPTKDNLIRDTVGIGAFATDVLFVPNPNTDGNPRLMLPVRGDASLHWIDVVDGKLFCDQNQTDDNSCAASHRAGRVAAEDNNNVSQPAEPFGIAATENGRYVAITNQTTGSVSLYLNNWQATTDAPAGAPAPLIDNGPQLVALLGFLPVAPVAIAAVPSVLGATGAPTLAAAADASANTFAPPPGFLVAYRNVAQIDLLRVRDDSVDNATDPLAVGYSRITLDVAGSAAIQTNSLGFDSRDIVIDDSARKLLCGEPKDTDTYRACVPTAPQPAVYVANRAPSSLLVGSMTHDISFATGSNDLPSFGDSVYLSAGPSRLVLGRVRVPPSGKDDPKNGFGLNDESTPPRKFDLATRIFIVCFDSARIFVYDPSRRTIESVIDTGRGPYALAIDEVRGLAYLGYFTDSYLGVVSLDQRYPQNYAAIVASVGFPTAPRTSK